MNEQLDRHSEWFHVNGFGEGDHLNNLRAADRVYARQFHEHPVRMVGDLLEKAKAANIQIVEFLPKNG